MKSSSTLKELFFLICFLLGFVALGILNANLEKTSFAGIWRAAGTVFTVIGTVIGLVLWVGPVILPVIFTGVKWIMDIVSKVGGLIFCLCAFFVVMVILVGYTGYKIGDVPWTAKTEVIGWWACSVFSIVVGNLIFNLLQYIVTGREKDDKKHVWELAGRNRGGFVRYATNREVYDHYHGHGNWDKGNKTVGWMIVFLFRVPVWITSIWVPLFTLPLDLGEATANSIAIPLGIILGLVNLVLSVVVASRP